MNRQGKGKIEYLEYTWNPVSGCLHPCKGKYCFAKKIAHRFGGASETHYNETVGTECQWETEETGELHDLIEPVYDVDRNSNAPYPFYFDPTFHRYRLDEPQKVKKPSVIGVVYMGDIGGKWIPQEWFNEIMDACLKADWHTYMFLTKDPDNFGKMLDMWIRNSLAASGKIDSISLASKLWIGATITSNADFERFVELQAIEYGHKFISIEPLLGEIDLHSYMKDVEWCIVGEQTNPRKPPKNKWVADIITQCATAGVPLFIKSPLYEKYPIKIQQWPDGLL